MVNPPVERHFAINPIVSPYGYRAALKATKRTRKRNRKGQFVSKRRSGVRKVASTEARRSTSTGGRKMAKRRTAAQRAATRKLIAFNRRRGKGGGKRSRKRGRTISARRRSGGGVRTYASYMRTRSRRPRKRLPRSARYSQRGRAPSPAVRRAGRTLRRRRWALRGNPPILLMLQQGAKDAAGVVIGEIGTNFVESYIPDLPGVSSATTVGKIIKRTVAAGAGAYLLGFAPVDYQWRRMWLAGGLASVIKTGIRGVAEQLPQGKLKDAITQATLGEDVYAGVGAYPDALTLPGMGSYPDTPLSGVGDEYMYE